MKLLGLEITRAVRAAGGKEPVPMLQPGRGWMPVIREAFAGAWQRNIELSAEGVLANHAVFACVTLIAGDVAKLPMRVVGQDDDGIWSPIKAHPYQGLLTKPNDWQTRIQFFESWLISKLTRGNAYVLKDRDRGGVVRGLHVLDPARVRPLVADDGTVFYELSSDRLAGVTETTIVVPAREVIHDRFNCLFHPLVGLSPIFACGLPASQAVKIQQSSALFFANASRPSGLLIAPGRIDPEAADRLKQFWQSEFVGDGTGRIAVLGDGMKYEGLSISPEDAELVEQLKWTADVVCSTFHVPPYKIGVGDMPTYSNVQALNLEYYSQCLQALIEAIELCLDEGLAMEAGTGTEFEIANLLRMDEVTQMEVLDKGRNLMTPNEGRKRLDLKPVTGGNSVYRQQQDFSLEALAKRDAQENPFAGSAGSARGLDLARVLAATTRSLEGADNGR